MPSPEDLRALAARLEADGLAEIESGQRKLAEVERLRGQADEIDAMLTRALAAVESGALSLDAEHATIDAMDASPNAGSTAKKTLLGRPFESKHPFVLRAAELGRSMPAVAAELTKALRRQVTRTTIRGWYTEDADQKRAIPRDVVDYLKKSPWRIPVGAWTNGIQG